jgi:A/G-specific adenine glycosylase
VTKTTAPFPDAAWRKTFRRRLLAWYRRNARVLPWRGTGDPYHVWLSEIMLQQTQVATVVPYFHRFLAAFPTIDALAKAPEEAVLRQWEGLGYYRRARQLHRAAAVVVAEHAGQFPREAEAVRRLPGVGRYTAGAILSIAFDQSQPILEANTQRLHARLLALDGNASQAENQRRLWSWAKQVLPSRGAGELNQAMMELGAAVCVPRQPRCNECPVEALCLARRAGLQQAIPPRARRPVSEAVRHAAVVVEQRGQVLLVRNEERQRWAGLWDFPRFDVTAAGDSLSAELTAAVQAHSGVRIAGLRPLVTLKHGVTRFRITLECFSARACRGQHALAANARWVSPHELEQYPLSTTGRKLARLVNS